MFMRRVYSFIVVEGILIEMYNNGVYDQKNECSTERRLEV
jgi:hypothetical protein